MIADLREDSAAPPPRPFVRELFEWLAPSYEKAVLIYSLGQDLRWKAGLIRRLQPRPGERALDLACGTGLICDRLDRVVGPKNVVGLDINRAMLLRGRPNGGERSLVQADSVRLPFRDACFDVVTAGYLFKYVRLNELAAEIRRVLKPNGRFGGYDFSAPLRGTIVGGLYDQYLRRGLPLLARHASGRREDWTSLFEFLARIATSSGWETRIDLAFKESGFATTVRIPSLGGAVTWFWAGLSREICPPPDGLSRGPG